MDAQETALRIITNPIGATIILVILSVIVFCMCAEISTKSVIKYIIYMSFVGFVIISLNNHYMLSDFETEPVIGGTLTEYSRFFPQGPAVP